MSENFQVFQLSFVYCLLFCRPSPQRISTEFIRQSALSISWGVFGLALGFKCFLALSDNFESGVFELYGLLKLALDGVAGIYKYIYQILTSYFGYRLLIWTNAYFWH